MTAASLHCSSYSSYHTLAKSYLVAAVAEGADRELIAGSRDDEYRWAGCEDPKILITTSHSPSAKLKEFSKVRSL